MHKISHVGQTKINIAGKWIKQGQDDRTQCDQILLDFQTKITNFKNLIDQKYNQEKQMGDPLNWDHPLEKQYGEFVEEYESKNTTQSLQQCMTSEQYENFHILVSQLIYGDEGEEQREINQDMRETENEIYKQVAPEGPGDPDFTVKIPPNPDDPLGNEVPLHMPPPEYHETLYTDPEAWELEQQQNNLTYQSQCNAFKKIMEFFNFLHFKKYY